jgi:hypothetical protein
VKLAASPLTKGVARSAWGLSVWFSGNVTTTPWMLRILSPFDKRDFQESKIGLFGLIHTDFT